MPKWLLRWFGYVCVSSAGWWREHRGDPCVDCSHVRAQAEHNERMRTIGAMW